MRQKNRLLFSFNSTINLGLTFYLSYLSSPAINRFSCWHVAVSIFSNESVIDTLLTGSSSSRDYWHSCRIHIYGSKTGWYNWKFPCDRWTKCCHNQNVCLTGLKNSSNSELSLTIAIIIFWDQFQREICWVKLVSVEITIRINWAIANECVSAHYWNAHLNRFEVVIFFHLIFRTGKHWAVNSQSAGVGRCYISSSRYWYRCCRF